MLYKNDNAGDRIAVPERFFQYMGSAAKEGHSLYRCKNHCHVMINLSIKHVWWHRWYFNQSSNQSMLITATFITCINFEGIHLKCMPNICIQFWRALLLDLKVLLKVLVLIIAMMSAIRVRLRHDKFYNLQSPAFSRTFFLIGAGGKYFVRRTVTNNVVKWWKFGNKSHWQHVQLVADRIVHAAVLK